MCLLLSATSPQQAARRDVAGPKVRPLGKLIPALSLPLTTRISFSIELFTFSIPFFIRSTFLGFYNLSGRKEKKYNKISFSGSSKPMFKCVSCLLSATCCIIEYLTGFWPAAGLSF